MVTTTPLWSPSRERVAAAPMSEFKTQAEHVAGQRFPSYDALHTWSVEHRDAFWSLLWDFCGVVGEKGSRILVDGDRMPGASFFPDALLSYPENLLKRSGDGDAIVFRGEDKVQGRMSWNELRALVSRLQQFFIAKGVRKGDRIAAMMPNIPEAVACMLAATSLGAVWSSCSPDFGEQAVLDRFGQIEPVLFVAADGYWYNGKRNDVVDKVTAIVARLPKVRTTLLVDYLGTADRAAVSISGAVSLADAIQPFSPRQIEFARLPFDHPLYILFSSGTTGIPKCIVHGAGGTLLQHLKEQRLHGGLIAGDRFFHFTTCGWMMWNWQVSALASGATLLLYDGSPFSPSGNVLLDYAQDEGMTWLGVSAKFIDALRKSGLRPIDTHDLSNIRTVTSTGSPLSPESFAFVYEGIKEDVHLASMSGGTDIMGCFVLGVPIQPVWIGEIQAPGLGMAVEVRNQESSPVGANEKGELVCTKPFPSMPIGFWNDLDGVKYHGAYFDRFENVWCHGDFAEWTPRGGMIIHGRSDATLNPGGVRIGTSEIYNQVEQLPEVLEAVCIGQQFDDDVRIVLFVRLMPEVTLDGALEKRIRTKIRTGASPRHMPAKIIAIMDIPRTKSGKIAELAVRDVVHGRLVKNKDALANPESLELYRNLTSLSS